MCSGGGVGTGLGADVVGSVLTGMWSSGVGSVSIGYGSESSGSCTGTCIVGDSGGLDGSETALPL